MMWNIFSHACLPSVYLFLVTYLLRSLVHFSISFFFFLFLSFKVSLFLTTVHHQCDFCKYFSPSLWHWALQRRNFNINKFQLINYFFLGSHLWYLKRHCHAQGHLQFLLCCLLGVYSFAFLHLYVGFIMHSFFEACKVIHFSAGGCQLFQHYFWKDYLSYICFSWHPG